MMQEILYMIVFTVESFIFVGGGAIFVDIQNFALFHRYNLIFAV